MSIISKEVIITQLESTEEFPILLSEVWEWLGYFDKSTATRSFLNLEMAESIDFIQLGIDAENSIKQKTEIKMTIDCFKLWAMGAQTARGKEVRLYYLQVEKEWKKEREANQTRVSPDQFVAYQFERDTYTPWAFENPIASQVFLDWQGIQQRVIEVSKPDQSVEFALPTKEMQGALNGAFLNLNRSGLAMNKLFHLMDRIPVMQNMGAEAIDQLVTELDDAADTIRRTYADRDNWKQKCQSQTNEADSLRRVAKDFEEENEYLRQQIKNLKDRTTSPSTSSTPSVHPYTVKGKKSIGFLKPANPTD